MTVEIRHLRTFLAIAEERNLTRAATRLHVSQPALSRALAGLERAVGVRLVDRSTHHVALTDAGQRFETYAYDAVRAFEAALVSVDSSGVPLRIGHSWSAGIHLAAIMRAWSAQPKTCALTPLRFDDRTSGLMTGKVDAALTRSPVDTVRFKSTVLENESRVAVIPRTHRLARKRSLLLSDLADDVLVITESGTAKADMWPVDSQPKVTSAAGTVDDWLVAIASGVGFGVSVSSTAALHKHPDVKFVPLLDAPLVALRLAWPRKAAHPSLSKLVACVSSIDPKEYRHA